jgi:hypothetical protein
MTGYQVHLDIPWRAANRPPSPGYLKRPRWVHAIRHLGRFSAAALIGLVIPVTQEVDGEINAGLSTGVLDQLRVYAQSVSKITWWMWMYQYRQRVQCPERVQDHLVDVDVPV